jgi:hypothetical protein
VDWQKFKDADDKRCSDAGEPVPVPSEVCDEPAPSIGKGKCRRPQKLYVVWCDKCAKQESSTGKRYVFVQILKSLGWTFDKYNGWRCPEHSNPSKQTK